MPTIPTTDAKEAPFAAIARWQHPAGTPVRVLRVGAPAFDTIARTRPWVQGSTAMIMVAGLKGPVPLDMVSVRGEAPPPPVQTLLVYWADPGENDPATSEIPITAQARGGWTRALPAKNAAALDEVGHWTLGNLAMLHESTNAPDAAPCIAYVEVDGEWCPGIVETFRARLARLEAEMAAAERR